MNDGISDPKLSRSYRFSIGCGGVGVGRRCWGMDEDEVMRCEMDGAANLLAASRQSDIFDLDDNCVRILSYQGRDRHKPWRYEFVPWP